MTDIAATELPVYGMPDSGTHKYINRERSGLPESYTLLIKRFVEDEAKENGGIFVDVAGGTGELSRKIEDETGIKSISVDYSPMGMKDVRLPVLLVMLKDCQFRVTLPVLCILKTRWSI